VFLIYVDSLEVIYLSFSSISINLCWVAKCVSCLSNEANVNIKSIAPCFNLLQIKQEIELAYDMFLMDTCLLPNSSSAKP
jgi:hypothetical protein